MKDWKQYFADHNIEIQSRAGILYLPLHRIFMVCCDKIDQEVSDRVNNFIENNGCAILVAEEERAMLYAFTKDGHPYMTECHFEKNGILVVHSEEIPYVNKVGTALSAFINTASEQYNAEEKPISWEQYFMGIAHLSALRSKDPKTKVGACIVDEYNRILSIGYNGMPAGFPDTQNVWGNPEKHLYVVHAEMNAILNYRGETLRGSRLFVTHYPCNECAKAIAQVGIKEVVYLNDSNLAKQKAASEIFKHAGVTIRKY